MTHECSRFRTRWLWWQEQLIDAPKPDGWKAVVEIGVPRANGGTEKIVVTGTTARLIELAGDAVYADGQIRFPKWKCQVAVDPRKEE